MAKVFILPYKAASESAKALAEATGFKRIKTANSKFKGNANKIVINWGCSKLPDEVGKCQVLNRPENVVLASNKLKFFKHIAETNLNMDGDDDATRVLTPEFTESKETVREWLDDGCTVVARTVLNGNSGAGIVIIEPDEEDIVNAPLYVKYVPKKQEYRIHVRGGEVVDVQRKARRKDTPDDQVNWKVRNHDNGFIFARNDVVAPEDVPVQALAAVKAIGLDFGAVDIIYNEKQQRAYVLEINTAPGLSGTTLEGYAEAFGKLGE